MGVNKSKLRRERKGVVKERTQPQAEPEQGKPIKPWVLRLIMMVPPVLYACYLAWDRITQ
jgi:hypothetical protein